MKKLLLCIISLSAYGQAPTPKVASKPETSKKDDFSLQEQKDYLLLFSAVAASKNALLEAELAIPADVKFRLEQSAKNWRTAMDSWQTKKQEMDAKCKGSFDNDFKCVVVKK